MRYWVDKPCNYDKIVLKDYKSYENGNSSIYFF